MCAEICGGHLQVAPEPIEYAKYNYIDDDDDDDDDNNDYDDDDDDDDDDNDDG